MKKSASTVAKLAYVAMDPVRFAKGLLCHDTWEIQERMLRSVAENKLTAVKACNASSKTYAAAEIALWWISRYPDNGIVITTAPTDIQVKKLLWGEIHKAAMGGRIKFPPFNLKELSLGPDNYAMGMSTNTGVRFHGFHGQVLIIFDEAPGILPEIWEALEGIRAGGKVHVLVLGNPIVPSGPFYDIFAAGRNTWKTFTISAFDTPNLKGIDICDYHMRRKLQEGETYPPCRWPCLMKLNEEALNVTHRPYLITRQWVKEKYTTWGPKHPLFEARVLGQFPKQSQDALIALGYLEEAQTRTHRKQRDQAVDIGIDVAGPGEDETVVIVRCGPNIVAAGAWTKKDPRGEVIAFLQPWKEKVRSVKIDCIGIGYYFALAISDAGFPVEMVNVGVAANDPERFVNFKAEAYWALHMRFETGDVCGLNDDKTISQLAGIRYWHNPRGQVVIESKEQAAARGVKSPDRAEGVMLAFIQEMHIEAPEGVGEGPGVYFQQLDPDYYPGMEDEEDIGEIEEETYLAPRR